jgi:WD40 repeat protein
MGGGDSHVRIWNGSVSFNDGPTPPLREDGDGGFFAKGFVTDGTKKMTDKSASTKEEEEEECLICTLTSHRGNVLCVHFLNTGTLLASAGDVAAVLIYNRADAGVVSAAGGSSDTGGGGVVAPNPFFGDRNNVEH